MTDSKDIAPLYKRVKDYILAHIISGEWGEGDRVPSENELALRFNISRMTANRAFRELMIEGHLTRVAGVGSFVASRTAQSHLLQIRNIAEEIKARGYTYSADVIINRRERASADICEKMGIRKGTIVFHSVIVHKEQGTPIQLESRYVNRSVAPGYDKIDFRKVTPNEYLMKVALLQKVEHVVQAIVPDKRVAQLLELADMEPCLLVRRRTWAKGVVATVAQLFHPGSRYELTGRYQP